MDAQAPSMDTKDVDIVAEFPTWVTNQIKKHHPDPVMSAFHALPFDRHQNIKRKFEAIMHEESLTMTSEERSSWLKRVKRRNIVQITFDFGGDSETKKYFPNAHDATQALFVWLSKHPKWKCDEYDKITKEVCHEVIEDETRLHFWRVVDEDEDDHDHNLGDYRRIQENFLTIYVDFVQDARINVSHCDCRPNDDENALCYEDDKNDE